jgi:isocitrate dehydrogenase
MTDYERKKNNHNERTHSTASFPKKSDVPIFDASGKDTAQLVDSALSFPLHANRKGLGYISQCAG